MMNHPKRFSMKPLLLLTFPSILISHLVAEPLTVTVTTTAAPNAGGFKLGTATHPKGQTIDLNSQSILMNG